MRFAQPVNLILWSGKACSLTTLSTSTVKYTYTRQAEQTNRSNAVCPHDQIGRRFCPIGKEKTNASVWKILQRRETLAQVDNAWRDLLAKSRLKTGPSNALRVILEWQRRGACSEQDITSQTVSVYQLASTSNNERVRTV